MPAREKGPTRLHGRRPQLCDYEHNYEDTAVRPTLALSNCDFYDRHRIRLLPCIETKDKYINGCNGCEWFDGTPRINLNGYSKRCELELLPKIQQWVKELF